MNITKMTTIATLLLAFSAGNAVARVGDRVVDENAPTPYTSGVGQCSTPGGARNFNYSVTYEGTWSVFGDLPGTCIYTHSDGTSESGPVNNYDDCATGAEDYCTTVGGTWTPFG